MKLRRVMFNLEEIAGCVLLAVIVLSSTLEIVSRNLNMPVIWTNELSRYAFIWAVFIGSVVLVKRQGHIAILFLESILPRKLAKVLHVILQIALIVLFAVLIKYGFRLAAELWNVKTTTLELPTGLVYAILPVSCMLMIFYTLLHLWNSFRSGSGSEEFANVAEREES